MIYLKRILFLIYKKKEILQEVEFSSRGTVPSAVIYTRIQTKSFAVFLHMRRQLIRDSCSLIKGKPVCVSHDGPLIIPVTQQ